MSFFYFLTFSDTAKFAVVARNLVKGMHYGSDFSFFGSKVFENLTQPLFPARGILPAMPFSIAAFFKIFGVSDFSVIATSFFFYILLVLFTFLLGRKIFNSLVGILASVAVAANPDILNYAISGASESLLMAEVVVAAYLITLRKKWSTVFGFLLLVLSYFTRPHAFIFIVGLIFYFLLLNFKPKKALLYFLGVLGAGLLVDRLVLVPFAGKYFLFSITGRGLNAADRFLPGVAVSDALRGGGESTASFADIGRKVFYNLYNFYKLLPSIMNPYLAGLFALGLFVKEKVKEASALKIVTVFMVVLTFLVVALTIPFFRYIHPVVPLVYIFAISSLVWIVGEMARDLRFRILDLRIKISKELFIYLTSLILILTFAVGQSLGVIFLDSRFERRTKNVDKPPVYAKLAYTLRGNTGSDDVVVTNLDTWGTWYGERKTVWFPLEPEMLANPETGKVPFDAIFLTSYLIDDENYYVGKAWREVFFNPEGHANEFINENFEFVGEFEISADEVYEKEEARAILLVRKDK